MTLPLLNHLDGDTLEPDQAITYVFSANIAEELPQPESDNVLLTDLGSSQFLVKLMLLCGIPKNILKIFGEKKHYFCRRKRFKFSPETQWD